MTLSYRKVLYDIDYQGWRRGQVIMMIINAIYTTPLESSYPSQPDAFLCIRAFEINRSSACFIESRPYVGQRERIYFLAGC